MARKVAAEDVQAVKSVLETGKKHIEIQGRKLVIRMPNYKENNEADIVYTDTLQFHRKRGTPIKRQLLNELAAAGVFHFGHIYDTQEQDDLFTIITDKRKKYYTMSDGEQKTALAKEITTLDQEFRSISTDVSNYLSHTCEGFADTKRRVYLTTQCVTDEDGNQIWKSMDTFENDPDGTFAMSVLYEAMRFWMGIDELPLGITSFLEEGTQNSESQKNSDIPSGQEQSLNGMSTN